MGSRFRWYPRSTRFPDHPHTSLVCMGCKHAQTPKNLRTLWSTPYRRRSGLPPCTASPAITTMPTQNTANKMQNRQSVHFLSDRGLNSLGSFSPSLLLQQQQRFMDAALPTLTLCPCRAILHSLWLGFNLDFAREASARYDTGLTPTTLTPSALGYSKRACETGVDTSCAL